MTCAILHGWQPGATDAQGCRLAVGHEGPHEFLSTNGEVYQWETDWACDCEHCRSNDGDYCTIYWPKDRAAIAEPTKPEGK